MVRLGMVRLGMVRYDTVRYVPTHVSARLDLHGSRARQERNFHSSDLNSITSFVFRSCFYYRLISPFRQQLSYIPNNSIEHRLNDYF